MPPPAPPGGPSDAPSLSSPFASDLLSTCVDDAHGQRLEAVDEVRAEPDRRPGQLEADVPCQDLLEEDPDLEVREERAETEVWPAAAERHVRVLTAAYIEPIRVGEHRLVSVRCRPPSKPARDVRPRRATLLSRLVPREPRDPDPPRGDPGTERPLRADRAAGPAQLELHQRLQVATRACRRRALKGGRKR